MVRDKQPNTICRNPNCTHGEDGGRKHFYACLSCLRSQRWKAYCCCIECYEEYTKIVLESRRKDHEAILPERTDMTKDEVKQVMQKPVEEIDKYVKEVELKEYFDENPDSSIGDIVDTINKELDKKAIKSRRKNRYNKENKPAQTEV